MQEGVESHRHELAIQLDVYLHEAYLAGVFESEQVELLGHCHGLSGIRWLLAIFLGFFFGLYPAIAKRVHEVSVLDLGQ